MCTCIKRIQSFSALWENSQLRLLRFKEIVMLVRWSRNGWNFAEPSDTFHRWSQQWTEAPFQGFFNNELFISEIHSTKPHNFVRSPRVFPFFSTNKLPNLQHKSLLRYSPIDTMPQQNDKLWLALDGRTEIASIRSFSPRLLCCWLKMIIIQFSTVECLAWKCDVSSLTRCLLLINVYTLYSTS